MGKSYRKSPITPRGHSEKWDKQKANRKLRRRVKLTLHRDHNAVMPDIREVSDVWGFAKDGPLPVESAYTYVDRLSDPGFRCRREFHRLLTVIKVYKRDGRWRLQFKIDGKVRKSKPLRTWDKVTP